MFFFSKDTGETVDMCHHSEVGDDFGGISREIPARGR
jgi:hypothetical protein